MALVPAILNSARLNNFRLNYVPTALAQRRRARVLIWIDGTLQSLVRVAGLQIRDVLNEAPNTCTLTVHSPAPISGQSLRIEIDTDDRRLLFAGKLQTDNLSYEGMPDQLVYPCTGIDDTARFNARRPIATWDAVSASDVAREAVAAFAPGFTADHVQDGLNVVSITFDGTEDFATCLVRLASMIGGYFKVEDLDVWVFNEDVSGDPPDPIAAGYPFLDDPPIVQERDDSQLMTRVFGRGLGSPTLSEVAPMATFVPVQDASGFTEAGGLAIAATTPDGAVSERFSYSAVELGTAGSLVGPGVAAPAAPILSILEGPGLFGAGVYKYAYTDTTASGESLPSPTAEILITGVSPVPLPTFASSPLTGGAVPAGTHEYTTTFYNGSGETTAGPGFSAPITVLGPPTPPAAPTISTSASGIAFAWNPGDTVRVALAYVDSFGHTSVASAASNAVTGIAYPSSFPPGVYAINVPVVRSNDPRVVGIRVYLQVNGVWIGYTSTYNSTFVGVFTSAPNAGSPPAVNTIVFAFIPVTIPLGDTSIVGRRLYRRTNAGNFERVAQIAENVSTTYNDVSATTTGILPPSVNGAIAARVKIAGVLVGPTGTTSRKVYRTIANGVQLKLQQTIPNNTATDGVDDTTVDGSLGATAPSSDTSGFTQPTGLVAAGASSIITAGALWPTAGGWVIVGNDLLVRYSGVSGNTLTGIPTSGPGALPIAIAYGSQIRMAPALLGVSGILKTLALGSPVHVWVQVDDTTAQSAAAARESTAEYTSDGIHEFTVVDERRNEASLRPICVAHLQKFGSPILTVRYATRDVKTRSGKTIVIDLPSPPIQAVLTIQDVTITEIDVAPAGLLPRFSVVASSVRFSLEDLIRRAAL